MGAAYSRAIGLAPEDYDLDQPSTVMSSLLREADVAFVDVTGRFRSALEQGSPELYGNVDTHLSPDGHQLIAEIVAPELVSWTR